MTLIDGRTGASLSNQWRNRAASRDGAAPPQVSGAQYVHPMPDYALWPSVKHYMVAGSPPARTADSATASTDLRKSKIGFIPLPP